MWLDRCGSGHLEWGAIIRFSMEPNLFKYVWRHSKREQVVILFLVLISLPFYFVSLDLPKSIVNKGIQGEGFEGTGSTQPFLEFDLPFGEDPSGGPVRLFDGFHLEQGDYLIALSFAFLGFVLVNGMFKFVINTLKGGLGERMLRRLRYELTDRILRFPVLYSRKVKQAEIATMIKDEVEPLGGFIGDAFVTPVFLGGQALTAMFFIMMQSLWLGLVAAGIVLVQAFLIPKLRKRILVLGKERQLTARQLAGRVGELVDGAVEIHAHDTSNLERAEIAERLGRIFRIRFEIFQRKFFVKFLNNFLAQLTPFVFYLLGGMLTYWGRLDIGALVAVIAAYKDLPGPIKELIDWDQRRLDVQIKYDQVIGQFQPPELLDPARQDADADPGPPFEGDLVCSGVSLVDDTKTKLVDSVSFTIPVSTHLAVVGNSGSGKEHLGMLLANLLRPSAGTIALGGRDLHDLPQAVTGRRISYVGQDTYLFPVSVRDNLLYGLKHRPRDEAPRDEAARKAKAREESESLRAGNTTLDARADWIDYPAAGAKDTDDLQARMIETLSLVDLDEDIYQLGLTGSIDPQARPAVAEGIRRARAALLGRLADEGASDLVVHFDPERYNRQATLAENLLFGTPTKDAFADEALAENPLVLGVLEEVGWLDNLLDMGVTIAKTMVELFADLPPGHPFFEQFGFIREEDLPEFRTLVGRAEKSGPKALSKADRLKLRRLPFKYVDARHRLSLITKSWEAGVLVARRRIAERLERSDPGAVEFYRPDKYNAAASLQDNILFGRLAYGKAHAGEIVGRAMTEVLDGLDLRQTVTAVGLDYSVGVGGRRLTNIQRQKLAIARALLKQPDLLIINEAAAVMDGATQSRLGKRILEARRGRGVVWTLQRATWAKYFDRVLVMQAGRQVGQGTFEDLNEPGSALGELVAAG
jgi:putative ABC transport system ATP-binding protein